MPRVVWTPVAQADLEDVLFYIGHIDRSPATAERIFHEIRDRVSEHAENRLPGHMHPAAPAGWLYLRYQRWLVFYQPLADGIEVMRVIDAARDLPRHLGES